jgi:3-oxoacyl-[acyl-carrier protein] reductase
MGLLDGKVSVVLGASSGIGWRIAERFAEEGAQVMVAARRKANLEKLAAQIGGFAVECDITNDDQLRGLADAAMARWGRIDIAVNSAGINRPSLIRDVTPELLRETTDTLFIGFYMFMKHFGNALAASGGGSLINITSATAIMVPMGLSPYSGAKAGINFVTKIAAREYGPDRVRVNALAPTFVPTAMNNYGGMRPTDESRVDLDETVPVARAFIEETPLQRIVTVDDCADVAVFLASGLSASITGQVIPVDAGNHLCRLPNSGQFRNLL